MLTNSFSPIHLVVLLAAIVYVVAIIWAIVTTVKDGRLRTGDKVTWIVALIIAPVVALGTWLTVRAIRNRRRKALSS